MGSFVGWGAVISIGDMSCIGDKTGDREGRFSLFFLKTFKKVFSI